MPAERLPPPTCPSDNEAGICGHSPAPDRCFPPWSCRSAACNPLSGCQKSPSANVPRPRSRYSGHRLSWLSEASHGLKGTGNVFRSGP